MKLKSIAAAVLAVSAGGALASSVTMYGFVDLGLSYSHIDNGTSSSNTFELASGISKGSRFGLKGVEDLGNGYRVGFVLENGFKADTGAIDTTATGNRLFGREGLLYVEGPFGKLSAGRQQHLTAGYGSWGIAARILHPYTIGYSSHIPGYRNVFGFNSARIDNAIAYKTPTYAGLTGFVEWSGKTDAVSDTTGEENKSSSDRYLGGAVTWCGEGFNTVLAVEWQNWSSTTYSGYPDADDGLAVTLGGNIMLPGKVKLYLAAQYFDNQPKLPGGHQIDGLQLKNSIGKNGFVQGWGVMASVLMPVCGGNFNVSLGCRDAELVEDSSVDTTRWSATIGYEYPLSKRTNLYAYLGTDQDEMVQSAGSDKIKPKAYQAAFGITHKF